LAANFCLCTETESTGAGKLEVSDDKEILPSLLPAATAQPGPSFCHFHTVNFLHSFKMDSVTQSFKSFFNTKTTASRAANTTMSAHETIPGHMASIWDFASSITSKPLKPMFAFAFISAEDPVIKIEPSHPCEKNLDKNTMEQIRETIIVNSEN